MKVSRIAELWAYKVSTEAGRAGIAPAKLFDAISLERDKPR